MDEAKNTTTVNDESPVEETYEEAKKESLKTKITTKVKEHPTTFASIAVGIVCGALGFGFGHYLPKNPKGILDLFR